MKATAHPEQIGPYEIIRRLAVGGMGEALLARRRGADGFSREVVVKRLLPHLKLERNYIDMFRDEARIMAQLNHANITDVIDFGEEEDGHFYLVLEYVEGVSLAALIDGLARQQRFVPLEEAAHVLAGVARGLDYAHRKRGRSGEALGIVHRDVCPSNVLISFEGAVKLTDFGIARAARRITQTDSGLVKGKFAYMAPEMLRSGYILDYRADLFTLGGLIFETLTGRQAFRADTDQETLTRVLQANLSPPSSYNPSVPHEIDQLVAALTAREPGDRPERGNVVAEALAPFARSRSDGRPPDEIIGDTIRNLGEHDPRRDTLTTSEFGEIRPKILFVEPDAAVREQIKNAFEHSYRIRGVRTAEDASEAMARSTPDAVVCRVDLPGISSFDLCRHIRGDPKLAAVPFILIAPDASEAIQLHASAVGMQCIVRGPSIQNELLRDLALVLDRG